MSPTWDGLGDGISKGLCELIYGAMPRALDSTAVSRTCTLTDSNKIQTFAVSGSGSMPTAR